MTFSIATRLQNRWQALSERPFFRLVQHCAQRIFFGGEAADSGEVDVALGAVLAILAAPGTFVTIALFVKYGPLFHFVLGEKHFDPYKAAFPDEYFFVVLSMIVAGAVAVWKWDSLVPDRRDYANLVHLPIHGGYIFLANLFALLFLAAILSVDINLGSSILFPFIACLENPTLGYTAEFAATHLVAVILAGTFGFLAVLAIMGILMAFLPYRLFRKSSVYVRTALLILFVALLMTSTSEPKKILAIAPPVSWTHLPPPAWFAALCQSLRGVANPLFPPLALAAIIASIAALVIGIGAYALSYRRCFLRSAETMVVLPAGGGVFAYWILRGIDKIFLGDPLRRAGFRFTVKTLFRSETHSLTWIGVTAVGVMIAANNLFLAGAKAAPSSLPSAVELGVPLVITYFLIFGLRLAFEIPASLRANWAFRLGVDPATRQHAAMARSVMIAFEFPVAVATFGVLAYFWGWQIALMYAIAMAAITLLLIETLLLTFRKIPFTCSAPPFKQTTIVSLVLCVLGLFAFSGAIPALERRALVASSPSIELIALLIIAWFICLYAWRKNQIELDRRLIFDDTVPPAVELLDLTFRR